MSKMYDSLFPFKVDQDYYIYNTHTGVICRSNEKVNNAIVKPESPDTFVKELNPELCDFVLASQKVCPEKCIIRHSTVITRDEWLNGEVVHNLWLSLTEACNLKCRYCFGEYGNNVVANTMSIETARTCIDYFFKHANKYVDHYSVRFFGGEPLLNKNVLRYSIDYINDWSQKVGKKIYYLITTNGTLMDSEIMQVIIDNNVGVNISIDGDKRSHDYNRIFKDGSGSFNKVIQCINELRNRNYYKILARMTLSKIGIPSLYHDIEFLWNVGFNEIFLDLVETDREDLAVNMNDMEIINSQIDSIFELMKKEYLKSGENTKVLRNITDVYTFIDRRLIKETCMYFNPFTIQFEPKGDIYKCCRVIGKDNIYAGNMDSGIDWDGFYRKYSYDNRCDHCWAKRLCGGGCHLVKNKKVHCEFSKIMYSYGLQYYVLLNQNTDRNYLNN